MPLVEIFRCLVDSLVEINAGGYVQGPRFRCLAANADGGFSKSSCAIFVFPFGVKR